MGCLCSRQPIRRFRSSNLVSYMPSPSVTYGFNYSNSYSRPDPGPSVYKPASPKPSRTDGLSGLNNQGNTCFANAAIQCILSTPSLRSYFSSDNLSLSSLKFTQALCHLFQTQFNKTTQLDASDLLKLLWKHNSLFQPGQQNDSHEFLLYILDQMHEELKRNLEMSEEIVISKADKAWNDYLSRNCSIITQEFQGQTKTTLECSECGYLKEKYEPFMYLSLSIPNKSTVSLVDCLDQFCEKDYLEANEQWRCKRCDKLVIASKQSEIIRLPKNLIIHIKRFKDVYTKVKDRVEYSECLDLNRYSIGAGYQFELYGKIKHMGGLNSGHYVAVTKQNGNWYSFNDNQVDLVGFQCDADSYVLFYQRI